MSKVNFVHLHNHSHYSLLDGFSSVKDMAKKAKELGQNAIAITDHGVMYGAVDFYRACKAEGIKPIIGCEVYVAPYGKTRFDKGNGRGEDKSRHMVLLCKNEQGYKNLCYMVSMAFTEGFYYKPRIDLDLLKDYHEGVIALSACLAGEIPKQIVSGNYDAAKEYALLMQDIMGEGNFYLEIQDHGIKEQKIVNQAILKIHEETGIPMVCTNDSHYVNKEDAEAHDVLLCIQTQKSLNDPNRMRYEPRNFYIRSTEEMYDLFKDFQDALENTQKIADMCNFDFEFGHYHIPSFDVPEGFTSASYLRHMCEIGYKERYGEGTEEFKKQLDYELNMIDRMGFNEYFLIVSDFVQYAKSKGVPVGPGRGSAAGSMVSYCLHITDVDPLKYSLYFERFLNPERVSMPDIDMDFGDEKRELVIEYVKKKYGEDHVAQIVTFGTMAAKGAIRDVGKVFGMPYSEVAAITKMVPNEVNMTIEKALQMNPELNTLYHQNESVKHLIDTAQKMEGTPRNASMHAAGVVITKNPVYTYVPLAKNNDAVVCQYNMILLEELGLLKFDFLALRNLTIMDNTIKDLRETSNSNKWDDFDILNIPYDDQNVFTMLSNGDTSGVFQLESPGMTGVCTKLKPQSIDDLTAIVALYRPGPMDNIPHFIECKHNPSQIVYKHPLLEPILKNTYGILVYQEQVIRTFQVLAGYSLGQADLVRRAMSKKKMKDIVKERESFLHGDEKRGIIGCVKNGIPEDVANAIYDEINAFANYAFNRAHAVCYAIIAYQTAWLKYYCPKEYMAALLSSVLDDSEKMSEYIGTCKSMGIQMLMPDVNTSGSDFRVENDGIRFSLSGIKNVGKTIVEKIVQERNQNGAFYNEYDFCDRMYQYDCNKRTVESLIKAGAFDSFGHKRSQLMRVYQGILDGIQEENKKNVEGQYNLFDIPTNDKDNTASVKTHREIPMPDVNEFSNTERLRMEREVAGIYLSGHPMYDYRADANDHQAIYIGQIIKDYENEDGATEYKEKTTVTVAGIVHDYTVRVTKKNTLMAKFTLDDETATINVVVFAKQLDKMKGVPIKDGDVISVTGPISVQNEKTPEVICNNVAYLIKKDMSKTLKASIDETKSGRKRILWVRFQTASGTTYEAAKKVIEKHPGNEEVRFYIASENKMYRTFALVNNGIIRDLQIVVGSNNVKETWAS